jgi:hypothetical protein
MLLKGAPLTAQVQPKDGEAKSVAARLQPRPTERQKETHDTHTACTLKHKHVAATIRILTPSATMILEDHMRKHTELLNT